jgi:cysteine-rich repeat protein
MGFFKCDDGNLVSGDGCSSSCEVEPGWTCSGGTPNSPDTCYETCGDGRRVLEQCDDDNTVSGDGCSSTCTTEHGYTCSGGSLTTRDVCYETCGDGIMMGEY